ncbi:MAG TPA: LAGLIDADG family homing endonuclease [Candidatus Paceibacterota bacterium]
MGKKRKVFQVGQLPHSDPRYIEWRTSLSKRPPVWSKGYTKETHPSVAKISSTFKKNRIDNFKKWRIEARKQGLIPRGYPEFKHTKDLAFLIGMVLGDGNIYVYPRTEGLRIALGTDKPKLWEYVARVVQEVFQKIPTVRKVKRSECMTVSLYEKEISRRLGVPSGDRGKMEIVLPQWILGKRAMLIACLKGLYEAEASFNVHKPTSTYKLIFYNKNDTLLDTVDYSLKKLGFHPHRSKHKVQVSRKAEVYSLKELLSFREYPAV